MMALIRYGVVMLLAVCMLAACGHGQLVDPWYVPGAGPSGDDGSVISFTDPGGASIEGGSIVPSKAIIVTFASSVASIDAVLVCDGKVVDLVIMPLSATQFSLLPKSGRFPQKTSCDLGVNAFGAGVIASAGVAKAFYTQSFDVGCDVLDEFDNPKTLDLTAASFAYGSGCWKTNYVGVPRDHYDVHGGMMFVDALTGAQEWEMDKYPMMFKRIGGSDYSAELDIAYLQKNFPMGDEVESMQVMIALSDSVEGLFVFPFELEGLVFISYELRWAQEDGEEQKKMTYKISIAALTTDGGVSIEATQYESEEEFLPKLGLIKQGAMISVS